MNVRGYEIMTSIDKRSMNLLFITSFPKNSFDRFGDDLTQLILRYLWFEDKVRLECVSKQWRSLIFNEQFCFEIHDISLFDSKQTKDSLNQLIRRHSDHSNERIDRQALESILKKCRFIKKIRFDEDIDSEVLELIGRYCRFIK